jgi:hypothetical protein
MQITLQQAEDKLKTALRAVAKAEHEYFGYVRMGYDSEKRAEELDSIRIAAMLNACLSAVTYFHIKDGYFDTGD